MQHYVRPDGLPPVAGYSHAVAASGRLVVISGQVPADREGMPVGADDPAAQVRQVSSFSSWGQVAMSAKPNLTGGFRVPTVPLRRSNQVSQLLSMKNQRAGARSPH